METQEELIVEIGDLSRGGAGVARDESGRVIFVPFTAPGDQVRVKVISAEKRFAQGQLLEVLRASPLRIEPKCAVFGQCGGCQWQHIPYETQWNTKKGGALHALKRTEVKVLGKIEEFPAQKIWEYRNRVQMRGIGHAVGFFKPGSRDLVFTNRCEIAHEAINRTMPETIELIPSQEGMFKVEIEADSSGHVTRSWNSRHAAQGFRQIHDEQNLRLQQWVRGYANTPRVLDLYGGIGNLSLDLGDSVVNVDVVDVTPVRGSIDPRVRFHRSPVLPWLLKNRESKGIGPLTVITDPPREGLGPDALKICQDVKKMGAVQWLAVGCDPDSWARDLSKLVKHGWRVQDVAIFDFFPQTPHVECAAFLQLS